MTRWIAGFTCALALALAMLLGHVAEADGSRKVSRYNKCVGTTMLFRRQPITWRCAARQKCCYDWLLRRGTCIAASARCF